MSKLLRKNLALQSALTCKRLLASLTEGEIEALARHTAGKEGRRADSPMVTFARAYQDACLNIPNHFELNGEKELIDRVAPLGFRVLFDVGANQGKWSLHALSAMPEAELHAFEIVPATFEKLRSALPEDSRITLNPYGLSSAAGEVDVYLRDSDLVSSVHDFSLGTDTARQVLKCRVQRGDTYAEQAGIETIDFLKIDVEGHEDQVIHGFQEYLSSRRVRLIQFEYNRGAIESGFLLKNAYDHFGEFGYRLGRLMPDGVQFQNYHYSHEDFAGPNYVTCREEDEALQAAVSR